MTALAGLIALYLVATVTSQSLLDASIVALLACLIKMVLRSGYSVLEMRPQNNVGRIFYFIFSYFIVVAGGLFLNASAEAPVVWSMLFKFVWVGHLYLFYLLFQKIEINLVRFTQFLSALIFGPTLYSLVCYYLGADPFTGADYTRVIGLVNSATYHAHGNAVLLVGLFVVLLHYHRKMTFNWRLFCLFNFLLLTASVFLTFTRGIWISLAMTVLLLLLLYNWRRALQFIFFGLISLALLYLIWPKFEERINEIARPETISDRKDFIKVNLQMWQEHPLLGIGYGENVRRNREYWDRPEWNKPQGVNESHAHNQFVNVLSTTGVLGFILFMSFVGYFFIINIRLFKKHYWQASTQTPKSVLVVMLLAIQVEYFLACMTDVTFEYAKLRALIVIVWGLLLAIHAKPDMVVKIDT